MHRSEIIEQYLERREALDAFSALLVGHLEQLLTAEHAKIHDLSARVKSRESLAEKLSRPDKIYQRLDEITDVVGLRIITYFEDDLDAVAALIERELTVDLEHSIDKRAALGVGSFGYQSLHYVCRLPEDHLPSAMAPWLLKVRFEVQLRTVLQHAWAEIEHDLGYKSQSLVPRSARRRLSRLAGLLEIADEEFVAIRRSLDDYELEVQASLHQGEPSAVPFDLLSLGTFLRSRQSQGLDQRLAERLGRPLSESVFFPDYLVKMLGFLEIGTIRELSELIEAREEPIVELARRYLDFTREVWGFDERDMESLPLGYGVLLAGHLKVLDSHPLAVKQIEQAARFFHHLDYPDDEETARRMAQAFVERCGRRANTN